MGNRIEAVFCREGDISGRRLHYQVDGQNLVSWQVLPKGEQGFVYLPTPKHAESFMYSNARILGYPKRLVSEMIKDNYDC